MKKSFDKKIKEKKKLVEQYLERNPVADTVAVTGVLGVLALAGEIFREMNGYRVKRYRLNIPQHSVSEESVKIIFLTDLHGKEYGKNNCDMIRTIKEEAPDYILIGGDLITRTFEETDEIAYQLLRALVEIAPVYLSNGNHEQKLRVNTEQFGDRYELYMNKVAELGVHILVNDKEAVDMKGLPVMIRGLEIPLDYYAYFKKKSMPECDIVDLIGKPEKGRYEILMAHNPVYMKEFMNWGANLTLSGHLHGGIIQIPFIGGLITPQALLFPKYYGGLYVENGKAGVVSNGLGTHTVNIRFGNPAEIVVITLNPS